MRKSSREVFRAKRTSFADTVTTNLVYPKTTNIVQIIYDTIMPLNVLKKLSNNYIKACLFAYNCDFENFILYFGFDFLPSDEILTKYIVRGVLFSFDFAKSIKNCKNVEFNTYICRSVSARYIMSNVVDDIKFLKNNIPTTIWYPNAPSKDTCLKLLNIYPMYHYLVATVAILMNWEDVFIKCKFDGVDYTILLSLIHI